MNIIYANDDDSQDGVRVHNSDFNAQLKCTDMITNPFIQYISFKPYTDYDWFAESINIRFNNLGSNNYSAFKYIFNLTRKFETEMSGISGFYNFMNNDNLNELIRFYNEKKSKL